MPNDFPSSPSGSMPSAPGPATPPPATPLRHENRWPFILEVLLVVLALAGLAAYTLIPRLKLQRQYAGRRTMVAMWALIVERPLADDILKQGARAGTAPASAPAPAATTPPIVSGYQAVRIDSDALFKILRNQSPDRKIHFCANALGWLRENPSRHYNQFSMPCIHDSCYTNLPGNLSQNASLNVDPGYQFELGLPEARLTFQASVDAHLFQNSRSGASTPNFNFNGVFLFNGSLMPGQSAVGLAAMPPLAPARGGTPSGTALAREPYQIVILQALSADSALAPRLAAFADAERWLNEGLDGAVESSRLAQAWEARTSSAGPKHGVLATSSGPYRVLGIGQPRRWPGCWWDSDGDPVPGVPAWSRQFPNAVLSVLIQLPRGIAGYTGMELSLDLGGGRKVSSSVIAGDSEFGENVELLAFTDTGSSRSKELLAALERGAPLTFTISQGAGPWEDLGRIREGETKEYAGGRFTIKKVTQERSASPHWPGMVGVEGEYSFDPASEIALLGVAKDGKRSAYRSAYGSIRNSRDMHWYDESVEMDKSEIENFAIMRRPLTRASAGALASRPRILPDTLLSQRQSDHTSGTTSGNRPTSSTVH